MFIKCQYHVIHLLALEQTCVIKNVLYFLLVDVLFYTYFGLYTLFITNTLKSPSNLPADAESYQLVNVNVGSSGIKLCLIGWVVKILKNIGGLKLFLFPQKNGKYIYLDFKVYLYISFMLP